MVAGASAFLTRSTRTLWTSRTLARAAYALVALSFPSELARGVSVLGGDFRDARDLVLHHCLSKSLSIDNELCSLEHYSPIFPILNCWPYSWESLFSICYFFFDRIVGNHYSPPVIRLSNSYHDMSCVEYHAPSAMSLECHAPSAMPLWSIGIFSATFTINVVDALPTSAVLLHSSDGMTSRGVLLLRPLVPGYNVRCCYLDRSFAFLIECQHAYN